jgi:para-aminobenzoate synthetase component 1
MLSWCNRFNICAFLDNHGYASPHSNTDCLAAAGALAVFCPQHNLQQQLAALYSQTNDWLFGHISYDYKNHLENLQSSHPDHIGFPDICFFQPETVLQLTGSQLTLHTVHTPAQVFEDIGNTVVEDVSAATQQLHMQPRITRDHYIQTVQQLQAHIARGDCYEINFCQEFFATNATLDALHTYRRLTALSPVPFACYYKLHERYLLCASPERYLQKKGTHLLSQPIKGTYKRDTQNATNDYQHKQALYSNTKERSENVMIVDLVRNDLSKLCTRGSVHVQELFGIYTFPQVHQMISTVAGTLKPDTNFADILQATFPMGSMTGAPKHRVMQLAEQYEQTQRGIYSGCVGYITPGKDFDFNVVIRSIMYNRQNRYVSYQVGGAITFYADAAAEYDECMLKAAAMQAVLS